MRFGPCNLEKRPEYIDSIVDEVLDDIGLSKYRQVWPKYLSKGERQRLAMGSIITMEPDVIIVDEPTTDIVSFRHHAFWDMNSAVKSLMPEPKLIRA